MNDVVLGACEQMTEGNPSHSRAELPTVSTTLLGRVQDMQPDAWSRLVEVFGPIVYRWCRQSGLSGADAADVVQEVFASVSRGVRDFHRSQPGQSFRNWLATVTRNRVRDHYRRAAKHPRGTGGTENLADWQNLPDTLEASVSGDELEGEISRRVLELVRSEFEERTWLAFRGTVMDGKRPAVVAAELNMGVASVYQAKSRILRRLRQQMDDLPR